jgi:pyrroloquinoline quinone (PQQ) biosynthesis protein C
MSHYTTTEHPPWVHAMNEYLKPYWDRILDSTCVDGIARGVLSVEQMRAWMVQLYPFIHSFPKFLGEGLTKVEDDMSRNFFCDNIRVEKRHSDHWVTMGVDFGASRQEMLDLADGLKPAMRDVQSLTDWLWYINTRGTLAESVAATSFAIEGVTGEISQKILPALAHYQGRPGTQIDKKTWTWVREHAKYDDEHPKIAIEIVKRYATTPELQRKCMLAARRSLQLLDQALEVSVRAYSYAGEGEERRGFANDANRRQRTDRRHRDNVIAFPDRRFLERRGLTHELVA